MRPISPLDKPPENGVALPALPPGTDPDYAPEPPNPAPGGRRIDDAEREAA